MATMVDSERTTLIGGPMDGRVLWVTSGRAAVHCAALEEVGQTCLTTEAYLASLVGEEPPWNMRVAVYRRDPDRGGVMVFAGFEGEE